MQRRYLLLPVLLFLTACGAAANVETPSADQTAEADSASQSSTENKPALPAADAAKVKPEIPLPQARLDIGDLRKQFLGQNAEQVKALVGAPDFNRRDNPAEIWQYRNADCRVDLFLYKSGTTMKVEHVDVRGISINKVSPARCLSDLLRKKPDRKSS